MCLKKIKTALKNTPHLRYWFRRINGIIGQPTPLRRTEIDPKHDQNKFDSYRDHIHLVFLIIKKYFDTSKLMHLAKICES